MSTRRLVGSLLAALFGGCLLAAPDALAATAVSSNWSGYAVHRTGVSFRQVTGQWRVPRVSCSSGSPTYSAMWAGIGGYSESSNALEQTGTEADCTRSGRAVYSAWWELVPAPSRPISLSVKPGQLVRAEVDVSGRKVTLVLQNLTTHRNFRKSLTASQVDTASAEWIVEAPSNCISQSSCQTLPLANFGSAGFSGAHAVSTTAHGGSITSPWWDVTSIMLASGGRQFISDGGGSSGATAQPSALSGGGSSFAVSYQQLVTPPGAFNTVRQSQLRH
jgi:hypothetical protein